VYPGRDGAWDLCSKIGGVQIVLAQRPPWQHYATESAATGEFIAHARADVPRLLARIEALEIVRGIHSPHVAALEAERDSYRARVAELEAAMPMASMLDNAALAISAAGMTHSPLWRGLMDAAQAIRALTPAPPATEDSDRDA